MFYYIIGSSCSLIQFVVWVFRYRQIGSDGHSDIVREAIQREVAVEASPLGRLSRVTYEIVGLTANHFAHRTKKSVSSAVR